MHVRCMFLVFNFHLFYDLPVQVEADKTELQQQLERMGSDTGWLFSGCSETANYQHDEVVNLKKNR